MYICVYMYICIYVYMCMCMYMYVNMHTHTPNPRFELGCRAPKRYIDSQTWLRAPGLLEDFTKAFIGRFCRV